MAYRDQVAQLEHRLGLAEKRAARAEASSPRQRRLVLFVGAIVLSVVATTVGYALAPAGEDIPVILDGHDDALGPLRRSTWSATRGDTDCYLVADDYESRHEARRARDLVLRLYCGESLIYETPQLRYGERHIGGCISQTGRTASDHRLLCSERVIDRNGLQRGVALSADSVGHVLQLTDESGKVKEWYLQTTPYLRMRYQASALIQAAREVTFRAEASIRELNGSPLVHGVPIPQITGRSSCEIRVRSAPSLGLDTQCELSVVCDEIPLYTDTGTCFHQGGALRTFADYEATWNSRDRVGRRTPVAVFDAALGVLRLADQDRERGFSMTLEMQRPTATVAELF